MDPNMIYEKTKETLFDNQGNQIKVNSYSTVMHKSKSYDFSLVDREEQKKLQYRQPIATTKYQQAGINCSKIFVYLCILICSITFIIYKFEIVEQPWMGPLREDLGNKLEYWKQRIISSNQKQLKEGEKNRCDGELNEQDNDCWNEKYQL